MVWGSTVIVIYNSSSFNSGQGGMPVHNHSLHGQGQVMDKAQDRLKDKVKVKVIVIVIVIVMVMVMVMVMEVLYGRKFFKI